MEPSHCQTLQVHYTFLVKEMEAEAPLLHCLLQYMVLDEEELDEITALTVRHERNAKLLDFILRITCAQYERFLVALKKFKQEQIYNTLSE